MKKTKIVCTIGPASWDAKVLKKMIASGMNVVRINGAFADVQELKRVADLVRSISTSVALLLDIKGHEVRLNKFGDPVKIKPGDKVVIGSEEKHGIYPATYPMLYKDISKGQVIYVDKGESQLEVTKVADKKIHCKVISGSVIAPGKGMNFPGAKLTNAPITSIDIEQMKFAVKDNWDFIAASFVRNADDIAHVRKHIGKSKIKVISKIEDQQGVDNFEEILEVSDGIMIARGDMGSEMPIERLPILQKEMIRLCNEAAKPVITATNMLESMTQKIFPTRAEITDVANAVLDGTDALMTSGETTVGKYPIQTVQTMSRIAEENEKYLIPEITDSIQLEDRFVADAMSNAAFELALSANADKIIVMSQSGTTVRMISRYNLPMDIIAFVSDETYKRQLQMTKNVIAHMFRKKHTDRTKAIEYMIDFSLKKKYITKTDKIVILGNASKDYAVFPNAFEYIDMKEYLKRK